jgi:uncharacterized membrane protein YraQ (UPF0718 family)
MTSVREAPDELVDDEPRRRPRWRSRLGSIELLALVVLAAVLLRGPLVSLFSSAGASTFTTVFVSVAVGGLPFVVVGSVAAAALTVFVHRGTLDRLGVLPPGAAVPTAAGAGLLAPLGDATLPAAAGMVRDDPRQRGAAAVTFLLASAAVNPVVLAGTAVAFPHEPMMVLARLLAGLLVAAAIGGLWLWFGRAEWLAAIKPAANAAAGGGWPAFWERCRLDVVRSGGFLVLGALAAAVLTAWLPQRWLEAIGGGPFAAIAMALLAVLLSVRGGADSFVAASVSSFPLSARLAFLVVGPVANLRLFTHEVSRIGPRFALRVAPLALVLGVLAALLLGAVLL